MVEDIKGLLDDAASQNQPASTIDTVQIVARGKRSVRGRRLKAGGAATAGIAVLAAGALLLPSAFAGNNDGPDRLGDGQAADSPAEQPKFTLPDVEEKDGYKYQWDAEGTAKDPNGMHDDSSTTTDATAQYDKAFWKYMQDNFDEIGVTVAPKIETYVPMTDGNRPVLTRNMMELNEYPGNGEDPTSVSTEAIPQYGLNVDLTLSGKKSKVDDLIIATVYPNGGFKSGEGDTFEYLYTCEASKAGPSGKQAAAQKHTCEESTGPNGEKIVNISTSFMTGTEKMTERGRENTAVVYREDGTAVVVSDSSMFLDRESRDVADPTMTAEQLTELALSMPGDIVE